MTLARTLCLRLINVKVKVSFRRQARVAVAVPVQGDAPEVLAKVNSSTLIQRRIAVVWIEWKACL